jgi:hypothetical protein
LANLALAVSLTAAALPGLVHAQSDGTDADLSAVSTDCVILRAEAMPIVASATPAIPVDGEPIGTPASGATPVATPIEPLASPVASPVADVATPVSDVEATPGADMTMVDPNVQVANDLVTISSTLLNCFNDRDFSTFAQLTSDSARGAMFGTTDGLSADVFVGLANTLPEDERTLVAVEDVTRIDDTTVSAIVSYTVAAQLRTELWTFINQRVDGLPTWVLNTIAPATTSAPEGAATIEISIADGTYTLEPATVAGPDVVLDVRNTDPNAIHETLILRLAEGVTTDALLQSTGGTLPEGVTLVGQASFAPGGEGQLVLLGLAPGTYTIVDLLPNADGLPHLSTGMEATFTVS